MGIIAGQRIVTAAESRLNPPSPYVFGGGHGQFPGPTTINGKTGFDCSGFSRWSVYTAAVFLGMLHPDILGQSTSESQFADAIGGRCDGSQLGDLLFFEPTSAGPNHVGIEVGGAMMIDDPHTGAFVRIENWRNWGAAEFVGATRPANVMTDPKPPPPPPPPKPPVPAPPAAHAYAQAHGMVVIDHAEALLCVNHVPEIAWYLWVHGQMVGHSDRNIPTNQVLFAFKNALDAAHIPHAGA